MKLPTALVYGYTLRQGDCTTSRQVTVQPPDLLPGRAEETLLKLHALRDEVDTLLTMLGG